MEQRGKKRRNEDKQPFSALMVYCLRNASPTAEARPSRGSRIKSLSAFIRWSEEEEEVVEEEEEKTAAYTPYSIITMTSRNKNKRFE